MILSPILSLPTRGTYYFCIFFYRTTPEMGHISIYYGRWSSIPDSIKCHLVFDTYALLNYRCSTTHLGRSSETGGPPADGEVAWRWRPHEDRSRPGKTGRKGFRICMGWSPTVRLCVFGYWHKIWTTQEFRQGFSRITCAHVWNHSKYLNNKLIYSSLWHTKDNSR